MEEKRTFTELRDILRAINRPDAAVEVEKRLYVLEPEQRVHETSANLDKHNLSANSNAQNDLGSLRLEGVSSRRDGRRSCNSFQRNSVIETRDENCYTKNTEDK